MGKEDLVELQNVEGISEGDIAAVSGGSEEGTLLVSHDGVLLTGNGAKLRVPNCFQAYFKMGTFQFLTLGDNESSVETMREAFLTEQNNTSLVSALLLTIICAVFYAQYEFPYQDMGERFAVDFPSINPESFARNFADFNNVLVTFSLVVTGFGMLYPLMLVLVAGEIPGDSEFRKFTDMMGLKQQGGLFMLIVGLSLVCLEGLLFMFFLTYGRVAKWVFGGSMMLSVFAFTWCLVPVVQILYKLKAESQEFNGPITLSYTEVEGVLKELTTQLKNADWVSPSVLEKYIQDTNVAKTGHFASISYMTSQRIEKVMEEHVEANLRVEMGDRMSTRN